MPHSTPATPCLFCSIIAHTTPAAIVAEDADFTVFLDHRPVFKGHCLVVPRHHYGELAQLPPALHAGLMQWATRLAAAQESALSAQGAFIAINNKISQSVPHIHLHVVPRRKGDGLRGFFWPRTKYESPEEMHQTAQHLAQNLKEPRTQ